MDQAFTCIGVIAFLLLPPLALWVRFRVGNSFSWWAVVAIIAVGSWLLANVSAHFYGEYLCASIRGVWNPSERALASCTNDGARNVFALLFGWLYGLVYSLPYFGTFCVVSWLRSRRTRFRSHAT